MTVTAAQFAALWAALAADQETFDRLSAAPDFLDGGGFPILIATTFVAATQRASLPAGQAAMWSGSSATSAPATKEHIRT